MTDLVFESIDIDNFKAFAGQHTFQLKRKAGHA